QEGRIESGVLGMGNDLVPRGQVRAQGRVAGHVQAGERGVRLHQADREPDTRRVEVDAGSVERLAADVAADSFAQRAWEEALDKACARPAHQVDEVVLRPRLGQVHHGGADGRVEGTGETAYAP